MPNSKLKNYLHLHLIVFIWGFTAVLGKLITLDALPLVWYRMLIAAALILVYIRVKKTSLKINKKQGITMLIAGIVIALHWVTFFKAIKVSNVSVALATLSTAAFFTAIVEPFWYKRKVIWYELVFGVVVFLGLLVIFKLDTTYIWGITYALISAFLAVIFTLINGKLTKVVRPTVITFYEFVAGVGLLTIYLAVNQKFTLDFFQLSASDWGYMAILTSVCTAYAFIASVEVMKYISPYTVMLTTNLEPVYGIILAFIILGDSEKMNPLFYLGGIIILATVVLNGVIKNRQKVKKDRRA